MSCRCCQGHASCTICPPIIIINSEQVIQRDQSDDEPSGFHGGRCGACVRLEVHEVCWLRVNVEALALLYQYEELNATYSPSLLLLLLETMATAA